MNVHDRLLLDDLIDSKEVRVSISWESEDLGGCY